MNKTIRNALLVVWAAGATLATTRLWLTNPEVIPRFPEGFWLWLITVYGSHDGEDLANLELLVALFISFVFVLAVTLVGIFFWQKIHDR